MAPATACRWTTRRCWPGADSRPTLPALSEDDLIAISYTTGTTGLPKGALWTQRGVRDALVYSSLLLGLRQSDLYYAPFPMAGVPLLCASLGLVNGMAVLLPDGDFEAARSLELMAEHRATTGIFVPTMLQRVLEHHAAGHHDLSALRMVSYGSSPATPQLIRSAMGQLGCEMIQLYGLTEATAGWLSFLQHDDHLKALDGRPELLASCGRPALHVDLSIRGENGAELPVGEVGEIWVQGTVTTPGYLNRPDENAELFSGAWLRTHDLGRIDDDGYLYLTDRKKFLIITGGYNVYPVTVEAVLAEHPAVREVAVVGAPHRDWGEAVVAIVSLKPGQTASVEDLLAFCRPRLGRFEQPKHDRVHGRTAQGRHRQDRQGQPARRPAGRSVQDCPGRPRERWPARGLAQRLDHAGAADRRPDRDVVGLVSVGSAGAVSGGRAVASARPSSAPCSRPSTWSAR